ncbi:MAG TPA: hypothetical protein ENI07_23465 [Desulfobacterales bacterium]|nr:hypothetical protein [Desulfobacterales bacterium]
MLDMISKSPLEKRLKRHVIGRTHAFFAATAPGLEALCFNELASLRLSEEAPRIVSGGVRFNGRLSDGYIANLVLRIPNRILMRVTEFKTTNFRQLEKKLSGVAWELYFSPLADIHFSIKAKHSRLFHTSAITDCFQKSITTRLAGYQNQATESRLDDMDNQRLFVRVVDDRFTISLDTSGALLFKRGLKTVVGKAPLRETLASSALTFAGYSGTEPLIDPMCGSGTFSLEAAMIAQNIPPGFYREFAFMKWPSFRANQWAHIKKTYAARIVEAKTPSIFASDNNPKMCHAIQEVSRKYGFFRVLEVSSKNFFDLLPLDYTPQRGVIILNPPFGMRLEPHGDKDKFYREIIKKLKNDFKGWRIAMLVPDAKVMKKLPLQLKPYPIYHGGLNLSLLVGVI